MSGSELANKITEVVKRADKLVADVKKDASKLLEGLKELKGEVGENKPKGD